MLHEAKGLHASSPGWKEWSLSLLQIPQHLHGAASFLIFHISEENIKYSCPIYPPIRDNIVTDLFLDRFQPLHDTV